MDRQERGDLKDHQDLFAGRTGFECTTNMAAGSFGAQVRTGGIHRNADQLDVFARQYAAGPRIVGHLEALIDPERFPFAKLGERSVVPGTGCFCFDGYLPCSLSPRQVLLTNADGPVLGYSRTGP